MPARTALVQRTAASLVVAAGGPACFVDPGVPPEVLGTTGTGGGASGASAGASDAGGAAASGGSGAGPTTGATGAPAATGAADTTAGPGTDQGTMGTEQVVVDLAAAACEAAWSSGAGPRPCPTQNMPDVAGAVAPLPDLVTEDAPDEPRAGLATAPDYQVAVGFIEGWYAPVEIPPGARFRAVVACTAAASNCAFDWEVRAATGPGGYDVVASGSEIYDGVVSVVDVALDPWAGAASGIALYVDVGEGYSSHDVAAWIEPRVVLPNG